MERWYEANVELSERISSVIPDLGGNTQLPDLGLSSLTDIRRLQQEALSRLKAQGGGEGFVGGFEPRRLPTMPRLLALVERVRVGGGFDLDVDLLSSADITFLVQLINKWTTLQMVVVGALKTVKSKATLLPKPKKKSVTVREYKKSVDDELEKEIGDVERDIVGGGGV